MQSLLVKLALRISFDILSLIVHDSVYFYLNVFGLSPIWRAVKMEFLGNHAKVVFHLVMVFFGVRVDVPNRRMILFTTPNRLLVDFFVNRKIPGSSGVHSIVVILC